MPWAAPRVWLRVRRYDDDDGDEDEGEEEATFNVGALVGAFFVHLIVAFVDALVGA